MEVQASTAKQLKQLTDLAFIPLLHGVKKIRQMQWSIMPTIRIRKHISRSARDSDFDTSERKNRPRSLQINACSKKPALKTAFPFLVKPSDSSGARGQTICKTSEDVIKAVSYAKEESFSGNVLIEKYMGSCDDHQPRFLIYLRFVMSQRKAC